jgi:protein-disulfide isomerase/uncharacterized membrane protein
VLATAGCIVAIVLTYEEFHPKAEIGCRQMGGDCSKTIQSKYGHLGPIPTSLIGLGMYLTVAGLAWKRRGLLTARREAELSRVADSFPVPHPDTEDPREDGSPISPDERAEGLPAEPSPDTTIQLRSAIKRLDGALWGISTAALLISWWLQYAAIYILCSFCPWCLASALIVTSLFALSTYDFLLEGRKLDGEQKLLAIVSTFIVVCFLIVSVPVVITRIRRCSASNEAPKRPKIVSVDKRALLMPSYLRWKGDPKAPYALVEFADYQCPHCKKASERMDEMIKNSPYKPIRFAFRNFPLEQHAWAHQAALAAEAAGEQGKFWQMHDLIFKNQDAMEKPEFSREDLDRYAEELGLDMKKFNADLSSTKVSDRIVNDIVAAKVTNLVYTPSFYLITPTQITLLTTIEGLEEVWKDPKSPYWK